MANSSPCRSTLRRSVPTEAGLDLIEVVASADLADLRKFPFDSMKIDRSFVGGLGTAEGEPLVATILQMAESLKLEVVAEGIERPEQLAELKRLQCKGGQGFYFSKPISAGAMAAYLGQP